MNGVSPHAVRREQVLADSGCRNTVFNSQPQSAAPYVARLREAGVRNMRVGLADPRGEGTARLSSHPPAVSRRVELTDQPAEVVGPLLERYAALAKGGARGGGARGGAEEAFEWMDEHLVDSTGHRPGVTAGSFRPSAERAWASLRPTAAEERANAAGR